MIIELEISDLRMELMHKHKFRWRREGCKGHEESFDDFMVLSTHKETERGPCEIFRDSSVPVSAQLFKFLIKLFSESESIMTPILNVFDVSPNKISPFCKT